jgi:hypothetical protein
LLGAFFGVGEGLADEEIENIHQVGLSGGFQRRV